MDSFGEAGGTKEAVAHATAWLEREHMYANLREVAAELCDHFEARGACPHSQSLPPNPHPVEDYFAYYPASSDLSAAYSARPADDSGAPKHDFYEQANPNTGWKFHLNIAPADVAPVFAYLADNKYRYKYLAGLFGGGRAAAGKVFTLYVGSHQKAVQLAPVLGQALEPYLRKPAAQASYEFAPGITGRFNDSSDGRFTAYGPHGVPHLAGDRDMLREYGLVPPYEQHHSRQMSINAVSFLLGIYGDYFFTPA